MKRFIQGEHRGQGTLLPESLDDYVNDTNPVRVVDVFVDELYAIHKPHLPQGGPTVYCGICGEQFHGNRAS